MTTTVSRGEAMGQLWDEIVSLVAQLAPAQWQVAVPWCPAWSVGDLVSHLGGLQSLYNGDPQPEPAAGWTPPADGSAFDLAMAPMVAARSGWTPEQRRDELQRARDGHVAHLEGVTDWSAETTGPVGPTTEEGLYRVRAFDLWVHLQDLREALGRPVDLHDESPAAAAAFRHVLAIVPWMYAKRAAAPEGSTLRVTLGPPLDHDSVIHLVNRRAAWDAEADPGDCRVTATPAALTLLTSGRGDARRWCRAGALQWSGVRGEEFVERARMF